MTIIPTTLRIRIFLTNMFIIFHAGLILTSLTMLKIFNYITDYHIGVPLAASFFLMIAVGIPFGVIGWRYIIVRLTGKGEWVWSQKDLDNYNRSSR